MIFIDTGAWQALKAPDDRFHEEAVSFYDELRTGRHGSLVVTDYIIDEATTLLMSTKGARIASDFLAEILASKSVRLVWVDTKLFHQAAESFRATGASRKWSFTDCTSFELMRELGISEAFAFDNDFVEAGFVRLPKVTI